jgi:hypothetical protein
VELIFADDCGKDVSTDKYLVVAAVSFNEQYLAALEAALNAAKLMYGIDQRYELHWRYRTYKPRTVGEAGFPVRALTPDEHNGLRRQVLAFLQASGATVVITAYEHTSSRSALIIKMGECLTFVAERMQMHLQGLGQQQGRRVLGLLIADEPGSVAERNQLAERLRSLHRSGSPFIERFDTLVMNSFIYPSDLVPGIQLADFVAGAAEAFLNRGREEWWNALAANVRHDPANALRFQGYGLKIWPDVRPLRVGMTTIN